MSEHQPSETSGQDASSGIVYVLTNEAMPGLVKIGRTTQDDPQVRMDQLYNGASGVPVPFDCVLAMRVEDLKSVEKALHKAFGPQRINPNESSSRSIPSRLPSCLMSWASRRHAGGQGGQQVNFRGRAFRIGNVAQAPSEPELFRNGDTRRLCASRINWRWGDHGCRREDSKLPGTGNVHYSSDETVSGTPIRGRSCSILAVRRPSPE